MKVRWIDSFCVFGRIPHTERYFDLQLFAFRVRQVSDGITFFKLDITWDRWPHEHYPQFGIELTVLNCYNKLLIHT
jgi:hypothetical protein